MGQTKPMVFWMVWEQNGGHKGNKTISKNPTRKSIGIFLGHVDDPLTAKPRILQISLEML